MVRSGRIIYSDLIILFTMSVIGLIHLPTSFTGDQALCTIASKKMAEGGIIYKDLWDIKQPGIFLFYLVSGSLFGFNEIGIHAFEFIYFFIFSIILIMVLKNYFQSRTIASLVPLFTIGFYYAISDPWHLTQTEALVGFPMFLTLYYAYRSSQIKEREKLYLFFSGLVGGIVLIFKIIFFPIIFGCLLVAIIKRVLHEKERLFMTSMKLIVPAIFGALIPILITLSYFSWHGILDLVYWTFFLYPVQVIREIGFRYNVLIDGIKWFIINFSAMMTMGFIGGLTSLMRERDLLTLQLVIWVIVGFIVIIVQKLSWWQYHYMLLIIPLGILAVKGLDFIWANWHCSKYHCCPN